MEVHPDQVIGWFHYIAYLRLFSSQAICHRSLQRHNPAHAYAGVYGVGAVSAGSMPFLIEALYASRSLRASSSETSG